MFDIINVGYEYMMAEQCRKDGDNENAIKHYQAAIDNYNNADNEYMLSPDSPYEITEFGETTYYPSVYEMVCESYDRIRKLRNKKKWCIWRLGNILR